MRSGITFAMFRAVVLIVHLCRCEAVVTKSSTHQNHSLLRDNVSTVHFLAPARNKRFAFDTDAARQSAPLGVQEHLSHVGIGQASSPVGSSLAMARAFDAPTSRAGLVNFGLRSAPVEGSTTGAQQPYYMQLGFLLRVVMGLVVVQCGAVVCFEMFQRKIADVDFDAELPPVQEHQETTLRRIFAGLPQLVTPYWCSSAGKKGRIFAVVVLSLGCVALFLAFVLNAWQKLFWDLFQTRDASKFPNTLLSFVVLIVAWVLNDVYSQYIRSMLYIDWRAFMTQYYAKRWLNKRAHYFMQLEGYTADRIDNPDQRIQEDVHLFTSSAIALAYAFLDALGQLIVFVPLVLSLTPERAFGMVAIPGWLLYMAIAYSFCGTLLTHCIGRHLIFLSFSRQRYEADFRHHSVHIRDNSESITLYQSEANEEANLMSRFGRIKLVWWYYMIYTKRLSFFTVAYAQTQWLIPFFILAPSFFSQDISMGDLFQLTSALGRVCASFDWFINVYAPLTDLRATADRLLAFDKSIEQALATEAKASAQLEVSTGKAADLPLNGCASGLLQARIREIRDPSGSVLWSDIAIDVPVGQKVLISGPEGIGKSVLFKTLAGIWPFANDSQIRMPSGVADVLFVPQRPALPKGCSLRHAIAYPELSTAYSDDELTNALEQAGLEELLKDLDLEQSAKQQEACLSARANTKSSSPLDRVADWGSCMSPGMQQRLAIGHVFLKKPRCLFLDEGTSNLSKDASVQLYHAIFASLPKGAIVVSISHDVDTLRPLHDTHYVSTNEGASSRLCRKD